MPLIITSNIENNVIKVCYVKDVQYGYKVEYYYDGILDNTRTEIISAEKDSIVSKYTDKCITGYEVERIENLPLTISENLDQNVMKIYYVKGDFQYTIEYYYNGILDNTRTETHTALYQTLITKEMIVSNITNNTKDGYEFYGTSELPLVISENTRNNKIQVNYIKNQK